LILAQSER